MAKLTRIEQHSPTIRNFYFRDSKSRDEDYRKAMAELTSFSFTAKNLHDDAADSLAITTTPLTPLVSLVTKRQSLLLPSSETSSPQRVLAATVT